MSDNDKYTSKMVKDLIELFEMIEELDRKYQYEKAKLASELLGMQINVCEQCSRPMIPQRLWMRIPNKKRSKTFINRGSDNLCYYHRYRSHVDNRRGLTNEELTKLRKAVGLIQ